MKRFLFGIAMALTLVGSASAQVFSLQSMDDLSAFETGARDVRGSLGRTDDIYFLGTRYNQTLTDQWRVFGGIGYAFDSDDSDNSATVINGGGLWRLPDHLPGAGEDAVNLSARGELIIPFHDDLDAWLILAGLHGARDVSMDGRYRAYGGAGLYYIDYELDTVRVTLDTSRWPPRLVTRKDTYSDTETGIYLTGGMTYQHTDRIKFYGEITYVDTKDFDQDLTIGVGAGMAL